MTLQLYQSRSECIQVGPHRECVNKHTPACLAPHSGTTCCSLFRSVLCRMLSAHDAPRFRSDFGRTDGRGNPNGFGHMLISVRLPSKLSMLSVSIITWLELLSALDLIERPLKDARHSWYASAGKDTLIFQVLASRRQQDRASEGSKSKIR